ncbi:MAG: response regulator transcription factor [Lachnospiraceae bacterium]|nr:response regulator transcription factor [Lachnospiraceae bacterium]
MNHNILVLIVEDDASVRNLMKTTMKANGYRYITAENGNLAIMEAASHKPDIMLLDIGLPDIDGIEVIEKIRSWSNIPIIVISARSDDEDKIEALDAGADDYLTKPFSVDELLARIRVTERRLEYIGAFKAEEPCLVNGRLRIDYSAGCVFLDDEELHLTLIEYKLLCIFSKNLGKVLTYTYITKEIWGQCTESNIASMRVYMTSLRKKIEVKDKPVQYIQTHIGIGYRMMKV